MEPVRHAIVRVSDGLVVNNIDLIPGTEYSPGDGLLLVIAPADGGEIGSTYDSETGVFTSAQAPEPPADGPFEISPGQLRNRLPLQACTWFRVNYSKPDSDQSKNQTAATVWERILNSNTINVRSASVQALGELVLSWNVDGIDASVMAHVLAPVRYDGETSTGLLG